MSFLTLSKHWGHPEKLARENGSPGQEQKHVVCGTEAHLRITELATAFLGRKYFSRKAPVLSETLRYCISQYCDRRCYDSWREDGPCWLWTFPALPSSLGCVSSELKTETHSQCCHLHWMSDRPKSPPKLTSTSHALFYLCPYFPHQTIYHSIHPRAKLDSGSILNTSLSYTTDLGVRSPYTLYTNPLSHSFYF